MIARSSYPSRKYLLIIVLFSAFLFIPAFMVGPGGSDVHGQGLVVKLFNQQFWHGDLYPRWLMDMYAGAGSPIFFYYPPVTFFITAFFACLGSFEPFGYCAIAASALLSVILSGITFYVWAKEEGCENKAALIGSLLYISAPFHIGQNFYYSLMFSFVWSYAWIPLAMVLAKNIAQDKPYCLIGFSVILSVLIMTSMPMTIIFGPILIVYAALHFPKEKFISKSFTMFGATVLGFGLAAIYLVPVLLYKNYANVEMYWKMPFHKGGFSTYLLTLGFTETIQGLFTTYWILAALLAALYFKVTSHKITHLFLFLVITAALFMILPISKFVWELVPVLQILQFPIRYFAVTSLLLALFAAVTFPRFKLLAYALIILYSGVTLFAGFSTRLSYDDFKKNTPAHAEQYELNIDQYSTYLTTPDLLLRYYTQEGIDDVKKHQDKVEVVKGEVKTDVLKWQPRDIAIHYNAAEDSVLRIRQLDFPGFRAFVGDKELEVGREEKTGEILCEVPQGEGDITLKLTALLPEIAGKMISILCLAIVVIVLLLEMQKRNKATA